MPSHRAQYKSPFGPIHFTLEEENELRGVVDTFLTRNLVEFEQFISPQNHCHLDPAQWAVCREENNVRVYNDKTKRGKDFTTLLTLGTLNCTLDDFQFAVNCPGTELTMVKSPYIRDRVADCATLATIEAPTVETPFNSVCVKWFIKGQTLLARAITKNRDVVYIESSRFLTLHSGERIGSHLFHSIAFPQAPLLSGVQRGNISMCGFTRALGPNLIQTYVKSQIDGGTAPRALVVKSSAEIAGGTCTYPHVALMKKLAWCLRRKAGSQSSSETSHDPLLSPSPSLSPRKTTCAVCSTFFSILHHSPRICALCRQRICSKCRVKRTLSAFFVDQNDLATMPFNFCTACVRRVNAMDAADIGRDEVLMHDAHLGFGDPSRSIVCSSSTGSHSASD